MVCTYVLLKFRTTLSYSKYVALDKEQCQYFCFVGLYICGQLAEQ